MDVPGICYEFCSEQMDHLLGRVQKEVRSGSAGRRTAGTANDTTRHSASLLSGLFATLSAKREQGPHCRPHGRLTRHLQARLILSGIEPTGVNPREKRGKNAAF